MNLPNKLTVVRVCMIPLFLVLFFWDTLPNHYIWAFLVFALASLTDMLDGQIARKRNLVTDFGKLMDPLADKLLVMSAFICLLGGNFYYFRPLESHSKMLGLIGLIFIMSREFVVTSIRLVAAGKGIVIAADKWGKLKTISQMVWICLVLLGLGLLSWSALPGGLVTAWLWVQDILYIVMLLLTVGSGLNYVVKNRSLFADA
ncbi:MAG: CDP-diacylglycerol--glycerol-3-phosphate 3-phosphatidyltransferase [Oscillospiraceae bacterium]